MIVCWAEDIIEAHYFIHAIPMVVQFFFINFLCENSLAIFIEMFVRPTIENTFDEISIYKLKFPVFVLFQNVIDLYDLSEF